MQPASLLFSRARAFRSSAGFTLIEVLVASAVIVTLTVFLLNATDQAGQVFKNTSGKIEQFREARIAYESITRRLSEATLNTYWDYNYRTEGGVKIPESFGRQIGRASCRERVFVGV